MTVKRLWPTFVYEEENVISSDMIEKLREFIKKNEPSNFPGGLFFTHDFQSIDSLTPELKELSQILCNHMQKYFLESYNIPDNLSNLFYIKHMWFNIFYNTGNMWPHEHHEAPFNGTLYLTNNSASTIFKNPNPYSYNDFWVSQSRAGKVSLWPGYLEHFVEPNVSSELRLTISFKFDFTFDSNNRYGRRRSIENIVDMIKKGNL